MNFKIEDSTSEKIPPKFEEIVRDIIITRKSKENLETIQHDIFLALIVFIMTENAFVPLDQEAVKNDSEKNIDINKKSKSILGTEKCEIEFILAGFSDIPVKLILCPLETTFLVNVLINDVNTEVYSICLPINQYVVSPDVPSVPMIFRNLKQLSYIFKNKIVTPVKSSILNYYGYSSASLLGLPEELIFNICLNLSINDIINVSQTCKRLATLLDNPSFWHKLLLRDFKNKLTNDSHNWKKLYKEAYIAQQDSRRRSSRLRCRTGTLHDLMDFSDFVSYIDNPLWDVIM